MGKIGIYGGKESDDTLPKVVRGGGGNLISSYRRPWKALHSTMSSCVLQNSASRKDNL